jgi:hypothetical protein
MGVYYSDFISQTFFIEFLHADCPYFLSLTESSSLSDYGLMGRDAVSFRRKVQNFLQNVGTNLPKYTKSHFRRP